jgi:hypothetical protein
VKPRSWAFCGGLIDDSLERRERKMRDLMWLPPSMGSQLLGQLIAPCDDDRAARLEVLRGIAVHSGTLQPRGPSLYLESASSSA